MMDSEKRGVVFQLSLLGLAAAFFVGAVLAGHRLVVSGHMFHNNILFGVDAGRNMAIFTQPGLHNKADFERSNVHPLFSPVVKPWARFIQLFGVTPGTSAVIVNSAAAALGLLLAGWYLARRKLDNFDVLLLVVLMGASATWVCLSPIPGSYMFSLCVIILSFVMTQWMLERPDDTISENTRWLRESLWYGSGLLNYGITVSNGMFSFLAYGFGRRGLPGWIRAVIYGVVVLGSGLLFTKWFGSDTNILAERQWYENDELRGGTPPWMNVIIAATPLVWSFVVPWPTLRPGFAGILNWNFNGAEWVLVAAWLLLLGVALREAALDFDPIGRRLSAGLAACLLFHIVMHRFYFHAYEGVFFFTPHSLFFVIGLFAPMMLRIKTLPARTKWTARGMVMIVVIGLLARNYHYFYVLRDMIPLPD